MNNLIWIGRRAQWLAVSTLVLTLAACGGGGDKIPDLGGGGSSGGGGGGGGTTVCTDPTTLTSAASVAFAPAAASGPTLSSSSTSACFGQATVAAVRSVSAVAPGASGIYYFEATQTGPAAIGIGTALAPMTGDASGVPANTESLVAINSTVTAGGVVSGFYGSAKKLGFAVDYRGAHPIVYVMAAWSDVVAGLASPPTRPNTCSEIADTQPCVLTRVEITTVSAPVYLYAYGNSAFGTAKVSINGGDVPYFFGTTATRKAMRSRWYRGDEGLNPQWASASPKTVPVVTRASPQKIVYLPTSPLVPIRTTLSVTTAVSSDTIQWLVTSGSASGTVLGTGTTLSLAGNTAAQALAAGTYRIEAVATSATGGMSAAASFTFVIPASVNDDDDGDGLSYVAEVNAHTDPSNPDTNGNGISDGVDVSPAASATAAPAVKLVREAGTGRGAILSEDSMAAAFTTDLNLACLANPPHGDVIKCRKRAFRTNIGVQPGEFRYFETHRLLPNDVVPITVRPEGLIPQNQGQGVIAANATALDPYCCLTGDTATTPFPETPPSMSINTEGASFSRLCAATNCGATSPGNFDGLDTQYIGIAVDFTDGVNVKVYAVLMAAANTPEVLGPIVVSNFNSTGAIGGTPVAAMPMVYGDYPSADTSLSDSHLTTEVNFGLKTFYYDTAYSLRTLLTAKGLSPNAITLGVGVHTRPMK